MAISVSNVLAAIGLSFTVFGGVYFVTIVPLQQQITKQEAVLEQARATQALALSTKGTVEKHDIRIDQNRRSIQLGEINAAKGEVQMEHLTNAIKELNILLHDMNKRNK